MNSNDIVNIRLASQQISATKFKKVKDLVHWMGAMQAQDYAMANWAIGVRLPGITEKHIVSAMNEGEIIRTHLMRPTWHFVSAEDIYWMLELSAPYIKSSLKSRHKELELTDTILKKTNAIIEKSLSNKDCLTREELVHEFTKAKIATDNNRASHLLFIAELEGILCSGPVIGKKQTYALLEKRVPKTKTLKKDEALAKLAQKYFLSHCPATLQDFTWWSGLSNPDARKALEMIKSSLVPEVINGQTYWFPNSITIPKQDKSVYLLPAFDEFIISYKDRSATLKTEHHTKSISSNGIFRPVIVINGQVAGLWKREIKKDKVNIEADLFQPTTKATKNLIQKAAETFGSFLGKEVVLK